MGSEQGFRERAREKIFETVEVLIRVHKPAHPIHDHAQRQRCGNIHQRAARGAHSHVLFPATDATRLSSASARRHKPETPSRQHHATPQRKSRRALGRSLHSRTAQGVRRIRSLETYLRRHQRYYRLILQSLSPLMTRRHDIRRDQEGRCVRQGKVVQPIRRKGWLQGPRNVKSEPKGRRSRLQYTP